MKSTSQSFCKVSISLDLSAIVSWLELGYAVLQGYHRNDVSFSVHHSKRQWKSSAPTTGDAILILII